MWCGAHPCFPFCVFKGRGGEVEMDGGRARYGLEKTKWARDTRRVGEMLTKMRRVWREGESGEHRDTWLEGMLRNYKQGLGQKGGSPLKSDWPPLVPLSILESKGSGHGWTQKTQKCPQRDAVWPQRKSWHFKMSQLLKKFTIWPEKDVKQNQRETKLPQKNALQFTNNLKGIQSKPQRDARWSLTHNNISKGHETTSKRCKTTTMMWNDLKEMCNISKRYKTSSIRCNTISKRHNTSKRDAKQPQRNAKCF